jgi:superfamily II DNA/RNA helicase
MTDAFPIQVEVIPVGITGRDLLVKSPTGSGKTLAFGVPIVEQIAMGTNKPAALVLVPTRELAVQVSEDLQMLATGKQLRCTAVYGGASIMNQARAVSSAAIVVATPGRLDDLRRQRKIDLRGIKTLVLDEADRMLDMGFQPQVDAIVDTLKGKRQTMLFSATLDGAVGKIAESYTNDPEVIRNSVAPGAGGLINHVMMSTTSGSKVDTVLDALDCERDLTVIFVRTQRGADRLKDRLREYGIKANAIHGGMNQGQRLREYGRFQRGICDVLVATDVFARGMDLDRITHVINYDLPEDADTYRHRTGRTGRAGREGTAVTMVLGSQRKQMKRMAREAGLDNDALDNMVRPSGKHWKQVPEHERFTDKPEPRERTSAAGRNGGKRFERGAQRGAGNKPGNKKFAKGAPRAHQSSGRAPEGKGSGTVRSYNEDKGFGFIAPDAGGADVFFHRTRLVVQGTALRTGTRVSFETEQHERGHRANGVRVLQHGRK